MQSGSRTVAVIVVVAAAAFSAGAAEALCIYKGDLYAKTTLSQEFRDSALVVRARVVSSRTVDSESDVSDPLEIDVIQPVEFFKGRVKGKVTYYTWHNSGGFYLTPGKDYLLFLDRTGAGAYGKGRQAGFDINYNCGQSMEWTAVDDDARSKLAKLARRRPEAH